MRILAAVLLLLLAACTSSTPEPVRLKVLASPELADLGPVFEELKRQCLADGVARIWVGTEIENLAAQRLYERTGAQRSETCVEYTYELEDRPPTTDAEPRTENREPGLRIEDRR